VKFGLEIYNYTGHTAPLNNTAWLGFGMRFELAQALYYNPDEAFPFHLNTIPSGVCVNGSHPVRLSEHFFASKSHIPSLTAGFW